VPDHVVIRFHPFLIEAPSFTWDFVGVKPPRLTLRMILSVPKIFSSSIQLPRDNFSFQNGSMWRIRYIARSFKTLLEVIARLLST
jgi:hypothetical protein